MGGMDAHTGTRVMTAHRIYRYDLAYVIIIGLLAAIDVGGKVWSKQSSLSWEQGMIDVSALMTSIDVASLPLQQIKDAF
jgi:hypothetical protein